MEAMTTFSDLCRPKNGAAGSRLGAAIGAAKIAGLLVVFTATALLLSYSLLFVLRSSPSACWLAANLIIFAVWRLSGAAARNHRLDHEPPPALLSPPDISGVSHDAPSVPEFEFEMGVHASSEDHAESTEGGEYAVTKDDADVSDDDNDDDDDPSMDDTWSVIAQRSAAGRATRPVLTKSETWERRPERAEAAAAAAATGAAVLRKSATCREGRDGRNYEAGTAGWRRREALVVARDELFVQAESFIQKHYDRLKLQPQDSDLQYRRLSDKPILKSSATLADRRAS